jgi:cytosine/adenosine deaminase-related metal-dependent hydrolase
MCWIFPPESEPDLRAQFVGAAGYIIANYESIFIHLAEGIDDFSKEEFSFVQSQSLLNPKGVIIHGIPLNATDFQAMAENGTALVWSPRSNLELYGQTANILAALEKNVEIALAPDWAVYRQQQYTF